MDSPLFPFKAIFTHPLEKVKISEEERNKISISEPAELFVTPTTV
jgi:hypothetical protein